MAEKTHPHPRPLSYSSFIFLGGRQSANKTEPLTLLKPSAKIWQFSNTAGMLNSDLGIFNTRVLIFNGFQCLHFAKYKYYVK